MKYNFTVTLDLYHHDISVELPFIVCATFVMYIFESLVKSSSLCPIGQRCNLQGTCDAYLGVLVALVECLQDGVELVVVVDKQTVNT